LEPRKENAVRLGRGDASQIEDYACRDGESAVSCSQGSNAAHLLNPSLKKDAKVPVLTIRDSIHALFCGNGAPCLQSWRIKCFQSSARSYLSEMDFGICSACKVDCRAMFYRARVHPPGSKERENAIFCVVPLEKSPLCTHTSYSNPRVPNKEVRAHWSLTQRSVLGKVYESKLLHEKKLQEGQFWDADHVTAVGLGGGGALLDNFQTLCKPCHMAKTKLDLTLMKELRKNQKAHSTRANLFTKSTVDATEKKVFKCRWCGFPCKSIAGTIGHNLICPLKP